MQAIDPRDDENELLGMSMHSMESDVVVLVSSANATSCRCVCVCILDHLSPCIDLATPYTINPASTTI